jgi:hypothetical protein
MFSICLALSGDSILLFYMNMRYAENRAYSDIPLNTAAGLAKQSLNCRLKVFSEGNVCCSID